MGTHWANIFASVGSVATFGVFGVGYVALQREHRRLRAEQVEQQASRVAVWVGTNGHEGDTDAEGSIRLAGEWPVIWIRNGSNLPIYQWLVVVETEGAARWASLKLADVAPNASEYLYLPGHLISPARSGRCRVAMRFVDAAGRSWMRQLDGRLEAIKEDGTPQRKRRRS